MILTLLFSFLTSAADFCTIVVLEDFHEFDKRYTIKVTNHSCTDGSKHPFKDERHFNVQSWNEGHSQFFPAFSNNVLKVMTDAGWTFKMSNNRETSTNFFFHKTK